MTDLNEMYLRPRKIIFQKQAERAITNFQKHSINAMYCETKENAVTHITQMIPNDSLVAFGGSVTIIQSGLLDALRTMSIKLLDRYRDDVTDEEIDEMRRQGMHADILIASSNAITTDGKIVCEDGLGNRVAGIIYGPPKVILIVGINKLVPSVEAAVARIKNIAAPLNSVRLAKDTPCARTGFCDDANCFQPERICGQLVIIESSSEKNRITVVLVGEELGF